MTAPRRAPLHLATGIGVVQSGATKLDESQPTPRAATPQDALSAALAAAIAPTVRAAVAEALAEFEPRERPTAALTLSELAHELRCCEKHISSLIKLGLPYLEFGSARRFILADVLAWARERGPACK